MVCGRRHRFFPFFLFILIILSFRTLPYFLFVFSAVFFIIIIFLNFRRPSFGRWHLTGSAWRRVSGEKCSAVCQPAAVTSAAMYLVHKQWSWRDFVWRGIDRGSKRPRRSTWNYHELFGFRVTHGVTGNGSFRKLDSKQLRDLTWNISCRSTLKYTVDQNKAAHRLTWKARRSTWDTS